MVVVAEVAAAGLPTTVTLADVVAVHADPDDVPDDGADPDDDLGWYATQEIADLLPGRGATDGPSSGPR